MDWFKACMTPAYITSRYETVPPLDPFPIYDCQLHDGSYFNVSGILPRLPDNPNLPEGQIPDRADLFLSFMDFTELKLSGIPDPHGGELRIIKQDDAGVRFEYESSALQFSGV